MPPTRRIVRPDRLTKIVATIGPVSREPSVLADLVDAGVDVIRINGSHATADSIRSDVARVRRVSADAGRPVAILLDLQGPKIRVGRMVSPLQLAPGDLLEVFMDERLGEGLRCGTTWPEMVEDVSAGDEVLFADGALAGRVEAVLRDRTPGEVHVRMTVGGELGSNKGMNLPGVDVSAPCLTPKDLEDLRVGVQAGVDLVALSFVRRAEDVLTLKAELTALGRPDMPVISKIEKPQPLVPEVLDAILEVTDGIMVARGDLGVEVPLEDVPMHQKRLLDAANRAGVLTITATQMLDSMERSPRPTRAETTDVANAILDGTDALMLSGETAAGKYPVEAVRVMARIARRTEGSPFFRASTVRAGSEPEDDSPAATVVWAAAVAARRRDRPVMVFTWSGASAIMASKQRPPRGVYALTPHDAVRDRLALAWGVVPVTVPQVGSTDEMIAVGERLLVEAGLLAPGDEVVILAGRSFTRGATNLMKVDVIGGKAE